MARELVWTGFMTLDGIVDSPGGVMEGHPQGGWVFSTPFDEDAFSLKGEEIAETSARDRQELHLRDSAAYANGVVKLVYDVARRSRASDAVRAAHGRHGGRSLRWMLLARSRRPLPCPGAPATTRTQSPSSTASPTPTSRRCPFRAR